MPFEIDDTNLLAGLDVLLLHIPQQAERGLGRIATEAQTAMHDTTAHGDITGATRASYRAFVIGGAHTGSGEAAAGFAAAQAAIANYTKHGLSGHGGQALIQDSGIVLTPDERGVLLTSFTNYQDDLEKSDKAVLTPTLQEFMFAFTQAVAAEGL